MQSTTVTPFSHDACWIWGADDAAEINIWRYFRRRFSVSDSLRRATLLITADSNYQCSVNGRFIGRGPIRAFPFSYRYDVYDITAHLQGGSEHVIGALVNHLGDHTMSYIRGRAGFLCEIILEDAQGNVTRCLSNAEWRTAPCRSFNSAAPRISIQFGFEEQYDARKEILHWDSLALDDSGWAHAFEIGSVGCLPWKELSPRPIPFLTENQVHPIEVKAVELARPRTGALWSLDLRDASGRLHSALRSTPPGERGSILFSEVMAPRECAVRIHTFPNYETITLRVNDQVFADDDLFGSSEKPLEATLRQGSNLVMLRNVEFPALLFETADPITFSAERFVKDGAWVLIAPLNELDGDLEQLWSVASLDDLPMDNRCKGISVQDNKKDIFALTSTQQFFAIEGGFCSHDITRATPRPMLAGARLAPAIMPEALLHDNADWTTINPQPDGDVHIVIDFGRELIGYAWLELDAPEGAIGDGNFFEGIDDSGIFWTRNLRNTFRYICREGHQIFTSHQRRGFRYGSFTFRNLSRPLRIRHIGAQMATYPVEARGHFACSDETLTKIWQVAAYTVQLCMLDTYVDCPAYEQVFWVGDARNSALVNAVAFGAFELTDHCVRLTGQSLSDELDVLKPPHLRFRPHITTSHVVSGWFDEIPMWTFLWIWTAWEHYWLTGDREALAAFYPDVRECLRRCENFLSERGLLDIPDVWNLVDWAAQDLERDGEVVSNTVLMAQALDYAGYMAENLGLPDEAAAHNMLAVRLRQAVNIYGWSDQYQGYVDTVRDEFAYEMYLKRCKERGSEPITFENFQNKQRISEPTNTLVLLCNAVPHERREVVLRLVLAARQGKFVGSAPWRAALGNRDEVVPVGSPWFLFFTLETLLKEGFVEDALTILREQWNRMLAKGATTFWETFPGYVSGHWSRSLCHGWSAAPAYFLPTQVLGITPTAPGYKRIRIAPQSFNLRWAAGRVPTPRGIVTISWQITKEGQMEINYHVPEGCDAEVVLPKTA